MRGRGLISRVSLGLSDLSSASPGGRTLPQTVKTTHDLGLAIKPMIIAPTAVKITKSFFTPCMIAGMTMESQRGVNEKNLP